MRDAFGGAFMIRIFLIFILIYILLTAVAMNYAKAYKVKELVVAYLEDNEVDIEKMNSEEETVFRNYINDKVVQGLNYVREMPELRCNNPEPTKCFNLPEVGIAIEKIDPPQVTSKKGSYYVVKTYFGYNIGFLKLIQSGNNNVNSTDSNSIGIWTITGETRLIFKETVTTTTD